MNGFKLVGLVLAAGFVAGTVGQIVGSCQGKKFVNEAKAAKEGKAK